METLDLWTSEFASFVWGPSLVVLLIGGGLGNIDELYSEGLSSINDHVFSDYFETPFVKPKYGDSSGVLGAALLWS